LKINAPSLKRRASSLARVSDFSWSQEGADSVRECIAYARTAHSANEAPVRVDLRALVDSIACDYSDSGRAVSLAPGADLAVVGYCWRWAGH
jgi:hypothetical protein